MTSHWEFLNRVLCEDIVRHVIQPYLLPSVETSIETHKSKWKKVMRDVKSLYRRWRGARNSHILIYYYKFHQPTSAELEFYCDRVDRYDLDSRFPKIVEILPPRFSSFTSYIREPDDNQKIQVCTYWPETDEVSFGESSRKWAKSLRPWWWWKLRKGYKYLCRCC